MARATLSLTVIKDHCLGREVFRGSAGVDELCKASWIDFHDPDNNRYGYQRDFVAKRSEQAAKYANEPNHAFWPECIFAIRDESEGDNEDEKVSFNFIPQQETDGRFGTLEITYNPDGMQTIDGEPVAWRRALSQVDCQHRLGKLADQKHQVTFCIFAGLFRLEEAIIFKTINAKQRGMDTSLVDTIMLLNGEKESPHIEWAWNMRQDAGSPYLNRVYTGGRGPSKKDAFISLRGLHESLRRLMPNRLVQGEDPEYCYLFGVNFWRVVKNMWPSEFADRSKYKLQTVPGQGGLAAFGQDIFRAALPTQEIGEKFIRDGFKGNASQLNWGKEEGDPLRLATGKGGQKNVAEELLKVYGVPYV